MKNSTPNDTAKINSDQAIEQALLQKAMGYELTETVEEFSREENSDSLKLCKRKVTKKQIPPDLDAVQKLMALRETNVDVSQMSEFELEKEKDKLLKLLIQGEENESNSE